MAVKAIATITLHAVVDVSATYRYYKLQSATLAAPSRPTAKPTDPLKQAPSGWSIAEPAYSTGSTDKLYTVDLTVFSDDTFQYSNVSLSSSYEAAKEAWNKANNAQSTADSAQETANSAAAKSDLVSGIVNGTGTFDISASGSLSEESAQIDTQEASGKFTTPGEYVFSFAGSGWKLDGSDVNLSNYGITLTETPAAGDTITVIYDDSGLVDAIDELNKWADEMSSDVDLLGDTTSNLQERTDGLSDTTSKLQEQTNGLSDATSKLQAVQETTSKEMTGLAEEMKGYKGCVVIDGDEPSITIGAGSDAQTNLKITSEKMSFMNNGNEAASLSNDTLKADSAEITNLYMRSVDDAGAVVGTLGWIARTNGHLSLKVIG